MFLNSEKKNFNMLGNIIMWNLKIEGRLVTAKLHNWAPSS